MRPPAGTRRDARHADRTTEQSRQLVQDAERLRATEPPTAADDDLCVGEVEAAYRRLLPTDDPYAQVRFGQLRFERLDRGRCAGGFLDRRGMGRDRQQWRPAIERRVFEQASGPALAYDPEGRAGGDLDAVRGHRQAGPRTDMGHHFVAAFAARREDGRAAT